MTAWQYGSPLEFKNSIDCAYCGEEVTRGQRCVERFRGVMGSGDKSGQPLVVADTYDPEEVMVLHEECEEMMHHEAVRKELEEDEELMRFCAGCGCKLNGD